MRAPRCWLCVAVSAFLLFTMLGILQAADSDAAGDTVRAYVGTYTRGTDSRGIYWFDLNTRTGEMTAPQLAAEAVNPAFLTIHPNGQRLYAVSEIDDHAGQPTGGVIAFGIDAKSGGLSELNAEAAGGRGPCHLTIDSHGRNVFVANYGEGSVAVLPVRDDGGLAEATCVIQHTGSSVNKDRQEGPHAHSINLSPNEDRAYVADLGLDQVLIYNVDAEAGTLSANDPAFAEVAPGAGPRHFAFHPNARYAYVINELTQTVTAFAHDADTGSLTELQTISTLPGDPVPGNSTADIHVHPSGKFLYGSNRGHNSIAVFRIDEATGHLTATQHQSTLGEVPRNFAIDPTGRILLAENQETHTVVSFLIDQETGLLNPTGHEIAVPKPVCIQFVPAAH
jgi:6-phosphogluconolactonase